MSWKTRIRFRDGQLEQWWEVGPLSPCKNLFLTFTASTVPCAIFFVLGRGIFHCDDLKVDKVWTGFKQIFFISVSHSGFALLETFSNKFFGQYLELETSRNHVILSLPSRLQFAIRVFNFNTPFLRLVIYGSLLSDTLPCMIFLFFPHFAHHFTNGPSHSHLC